MSKQIHPTAIVHPSAQIGDGVVIGPYSIVEQEAVIGDGTVLDAHVIVGSKTQIGCGNRLFPNCVIGKRPQILGSDENTPIGGLQIGDRNVIREFVTIHPSMHPKENTLVGSGNLLMIGVHLGHDCILEDKIVISNYTQVSGHCKIETGVWLSGMIAIHQFCTIGKWCYAAGYTGINHDVPPYVIISGHYPHEVRALNKRGMARAGLSEEQKNALFEAFKYLWRSEGPILPRVQELAGRDGLTEPVRAIVDSLLNSSRQRYGRYLELYRD
ncbi:MAG TPA: acyl-ACP--UDP-N-acetylglucosamine O-acyltransferase [Anaerohalosphaeraceae bacterium]|jgi:UDP-N-acetylglucosamine acyltransferase|nr:acyl-ACP--UDP-N-acetylglucosamine O-acyltransferase [Anaerohalosphaeraceae bacterium]